MIHVRSKLTSQGQVSVPAAVRRQLGLGPGAILEWVEEDGRIIVRRAVHHDSAAVHGALFPEGAPERRSLAELKQGVAVAMRRKHARGDKVVLSAKPSSWDDFFDAKPEGAQGFVGNRKDRPPQKRKSFR